MKRNHWILFKPVISGFPSILCDMEKVIHSEERERVSKKEFNPGKKHNRDKPTSQPGLPTVISESQAQGDSRGHQYLGASHSSSDDRGTCPLPRHAKETSYEAGSDTSCLKMILAESRWDASLASEAGLTTCAGRSGGEARPRALWLLPTKHQRVQLSSGCQIGVRSVFIFP